MSVKNDLKYCLPSNTVLVVHKAGAHDAHTFVGIRKKVVLLAYLVPAVPVLFMQRSEDIEKVAADAKKFFFFVCCVSLAFGVVYAIFYPTCAQQIYA